LRTSDNIIVTCPFVDDNVVCVVLLAIEALLVCWVIVVDDVVVVVGGVVGARVNGQGFVGIVVGHAAVVVVYDHVAVAVAVILFFHHMIFFPNHREFTCNCTAITQWLVKI
jgi:hypothetical protein